MPILWPKWGSAIWWSEFALRNAVQNVSASLSGPSPHCMHTSTRSGLMRCLHCEHSVVVAGPPFCFCADLMEISYCVNCCHQGATSSWLLSILRISSSSLSPSCINKLFMPSLKPNLWSLFLPLWILMHCKYDVTSTGIHSALVSLLLGTQVHVLGCTSGSALTTISMLYW